MTAIEYRPALDGLRALAVVAVMLFHLDSRLLPGGFVGVDVFFVLSGYLITTIIVTERQAGEFSLARFYQRRIARIFPSAILVIFAILAAASFIYSPQDFASAGAVAVASALSIANLKLMLQGNYFEISKDAQPLLHFWSLAIEEQFYLLLPLVVGLSFRTKAPRRALNVLLTMGLIGSLTSCIMLTATKPVWAFYLLPTRAWELLAGCLLSLHADRQSMTTTTRRATISKGVGLMLIVVSCFAIHEGDQFPGYVAVVPVAGAAMCIGKVGADQSVIERALSQRWMVSIGKASYSLYLWHWPVFCFVDYSLYADSHLVRAGLKIVLTIVLAGMAHRWFENPARKFLGAPFRRVATYFWTALAVTAVVVAGLQIRKSNYVDASAESVAEGGITVNEHIERPMIVLMGDSNGSMYGGTIREVAQQLDCRAHIISVSAGDPLPPSRQYDDSLKFLERSRPEVLVLVAAWAQKIGHDRARLLAALPELLKRVDQIILITQPPVLPEGLSREHFRAEGVFPIVEDSESAVVRRATNADLIALADDRVHVIDLEHLFVTPSGSVRFVDEQGRQLWHDHTHLSGHGTQLVKEMLLAQIQALISAEP